MYNVPINKVEQKFTLAYLNDQPRTHQVCAQTQVHSLFCNPINLMEHQCDTTEKSSEAELTALRAFRGTG